MKGEVDSQLAKALNELKEKDPSNWRASRIEARLKKSYQLYELKAPLSYMAISNAFKGKSITKKVSETLRRLIYNYDDRILQVPLSDVDLNLKRFWNIPDRDFTRGASELSGTFQTYARSNIFPDYIWLGKMTFDYRDDFHEPRIWAKLETRRPKIGIANEKIIVSDGFAAPNGSQSFFVIFRSKYERGDESGALCILEKINRDHFHSIDSLRAHVVQYEAETKKYEKSNWLLKREKLDKIRQEYIKISDFEDKSIVDDLNLGSEQTREVRT